MKRTARIARWLRAHTLVCLAVLGAYLATYLFVRHHRLGLEYALSRTCFETEEQGNRWVTWYNAEYDTHPLAYADSEWIYLAFYPLIQLDSALTGRQIDSPFREVVYVIPTGGRVHSQEPEDTVQELAGHQVTIRPGASFTSKTEGFGRHTLLAGGIKVSIKNSRLSVGDAAYGELKPGDTVLVETSKVFVSGVGRETTSQPKDLIVEITVLNEAREPIPSAYAWPGEALFGQPYRANERGLIRLTALAGQGITVGAFLYEETFIPKTVWQTNRFPVSTLKLWQ